MAFLSFSNIAQYLPDSYDENQVNSILLQLEGELLDLGFTFDPLTEEVRNLTPSLYYSQSIFETGRASEITGVKIRQYNSPFTSTILNETDYTFSRHGFGYIQSIELLTMSISSPSFLEITGKFGIYIDFDSEDFGARLLTGIVADFVKDIIISKNSSTIKRSKTSTSEIEFFGNKSESEIYQEFNNKLNYFL